MSLTVDWAETKVIWVPKTYLTEIADPEYELDVDQFRLDLRTMEAGVSGIAFKPTHSHNTEVVLGGLTYARQVQIINSYTVTFESGIYAVTLVGANNNVMDVTNLNGVSIRSQNSAGLIVVTQGSGVTQQDKEDIASLVWEEPTSAHTTDGTYGRLVDIVNEGNISYEHYEATVENAIRKVAVGELDYYILKIKRTSDSDWSSPLFTSTSYMWYASLEDKDPIRVGESD